MFPTGSSWLRRALIASVLLHVIAAMIASKTIAPASVRLEDVDIEVAPMAPKAEALPAEVAKLPDEDEAALRGTHAAGASQPDEATDTSGVAPGPDGPADAAIADAAPLDSAVDAMKPDAAKPDAAIDAPLVAVAVDAGVDAPQVAVVVEAPQLAANVDAAIDAPEVAVVADAGVDAPEVAANTDAAIDAPQLAVTVDAGVDAPLVASNVDAGVDAPQVAILADAGASVRDSDSSAVAANGSGSGSGSGIGSGNGNGSGIGSGNGSGMGSGLGSGHGPGSGIGIGSGNGSGSGSGSGNGLGGGSGSGGGGARNPDGSLATVAGAGSGKPGTENLQAVDGDATQTPGTAANLLAYFPKGQVVSALIRFDRLRDNEWGEPTEKILKPLPDYQALFGTRDARIADRFDTLIIASPRPHDATATILVGKTAMTRVMLRDYLAKNTKVAWSAAKGGLLGRRKSRIPKDERVFLSPFAGWFLLAEPGDLGSALDPTTANMDRCEISGPVPAWLSGIRKIWDESGGDKPGPALVLTMAFDGKPLAVAKQIGLGISSIQTPLRFSLAMEIVKGGWLIRGNMLFSNEAAATAFVTTATQAKKAAPNTSLLKGFGGRNLENFINNLSFAQGGDRVSYATSISVADARALLAVAAALVEDAFRKQQLPP